MCPYYASYKEVSRKIPHAVSGNTPWDILRAAISQYFSSISIPMALRPKSLAARSVVPEPHEGVEDGFAANLKQVNEQG